MVVLVSLRGILKGKDHIPSQLPHPLSTRLWSLSPKRTCRIHWYTSVLPWITLTSLRVWFLPFWELSNKCPFEVLRKVTQHTLGSALLESSTGKRSTEWRLKEAGMRLSLRPQFKSVLGAAEGCWDSMFLRDDPIFEMMFFNDKDKAFCWPFLRSLLQLPQPLEQQTATFSAPSLEVTESESSPAANVKGKRARESSGSRPPSSALTMDEPTISIRPSVSLSASSP